MTADFVLPKLRLGRGTAEGGGGAAGEAGGLRPPPLHHPLRDWFPSPSSLGED